MPRYDVTLLLEVTANIYDLEAKDATEAKEQAIQAYAESRRLSDLEDDTLELDGLSVSFGQVREAIVDESLQDE